MSVKPNRAVVLATRIGVPIAVLLVGFLIYGGLVATGKSQASTREEAPPARTVVFEARPVEVRRQWRGYGTSEADVAADVPARVGATVAEVPADVREGRAVKAGQVLVRLDPTDFQRRVEQAEQTLSAIAAQLRQLDAEEASLRERLPIEEQDVAIAQRELERVRGVVERGAGNQQDLDVAERNLVAARRNRMQVTQDIAQLDARRANLQAQQTGQQSALRMAQQDVLRADVTSPCDGILQSVDVEPGEDVQPGQRVARVSSLGTIEVPVRLPSSARASVGEGAEVMLRPTTGSVECWFAKIERLAPEDDPGSRTLTAYVTVEQGDRIATKDGVQPLLYPGRFLEGTVTAAASEARWVVPRRSVKAGRIFVVQNDARGGVLRSVPVEVDYPLEGEVAELSEVGETQWAVLTPGAERVLQPGTKVVLNAAASLMDGERVAAVPVSEVGEGGSQAEATGVAHRIDDTEAQAEEATP